MDRLFETGGPALPGGPGKRSDAPAMLRLRVPACGEAVVIVDVDQFDAIRERHGPHAGEQVTRAVADCLRRRLRPGDRLALLRAEEFLVVLPGTCETAVPSIETRLRAGIEGLRLALAGTVWNLSCTTGSAARRTQPSALDGLVRAADTALHRAKHPAGTGRRPV